MSKFDDYINGLEGQENIDPLEVASKLHELHNEEIGTSTAKIEELNGTIAERDSVVAERDTEIQKWKAKNFDLAMQIPGQSSPRVENEPTDNSGISVDDLFKSKGNN